MKPHELIRQLIETVTRLSKADIEQLLRDMGYENLKVAGNKINVLVQIPNGQKKNDFRKLMLDEILDGLTQQVPDQHPQFSEDPGISSLGGIVFPTSPVQIVVKDIGKQGDKSAGVANELELAGMLDSIIETYGSTTVTFKDERGKKLTITQCTAVELAGKDTADRKKADVVLRSEEGSLPISIKKLDADMWESADNLFGERARKILDKLVKEGVVKLTQINTRSNKRTGEDVPVYALSKEIVMEPTEEEALSAIFGADINPEGGVVIQTFKPEHFQQTEDSVTINCHSVIANSADIPESHLMVWLLRNDSTRNGGSLGIAGIRPLGVTLSRGIGKKGTKDVILVDVNGNVVEKGPTKEKLAKSEEEFSADASAIASGSKRRAKKAPEEPVPGLGRSMRKR